MGDARDANLIPGSARYPGEGNGTHCNILAWAIPWAEETIWLQSIGLQESDTTEHMHVHTHTHTLEDRE